MPDRPTRGYSFSKEIDERLEELLYGPAGPTTKGLEASPARFKEASELYLEGYRGLRRDLPEGKSTHELITRAGQRLAAPPSGSPDREAVVAASVGPDKESKGWKLFFEGHFYGETRGGGLGNYMGWVFSPTLRALMAAFDNIEEHAHGNFLKQVDLVKQSPADATRHGWALHYLQDLTAPHHVRNLPIFLRREGYDVDTHHAFEKAANARFAERPERYDDGARTTLTAIRAMGFDLRKADGARGFVDWVHGRALGIAEGDWIKAGESPAWLPKIDAALELAVAATAYFVERI